VDFRRSGPAGLIAESTLTPFLFAAKSTLTPFFLFSLTPFFRPHFFAAMLDPQAAVLASNQLKQLAAGWHEIDPSDIVCETAARFLWVHALKAAGAPSWRQLSLPGKNDHSRWK